LRYVSGETTDRQTDAHTHRSTPPALVDKCFQPFSCVFGRLQDDDERDLLSSETDSQTVYLAVLSNTNDVTPAVGLYTHCESETQDSILSSVTSPNVNRPIFKILSLLDSVGNLLTKSYLNHTLNVSLHYSVKYLRSKIAMLKE